MYIPLVLLTCVFYSVFCWDLSDLGIASNYYVSSIAIFRTRAFLSLPRDACQNNVTQSTIVEVPWTGEFHIPFFRKWLISNTNIPQEYGNCDDVQNAVSIDIEPRRPKLWILDKGNDLCPAKIVIYNLLQNSVIYSIVLSGIPNKNLNFLTIDPAFSLTGSKAFIGDPGDNTLIVLSLTNLNWWRVKLVPDSEIVANVPSAYLAVSKTDPVLYMCGEDSTHIFSLDIEDIRNEDHPLPVETMNTMIEKNVTYLGEKLGPSVGLVTDLKGGLTYYSIRDYAVMRWNTRGPLIAEYHDVLAQSFESLPYVSQLFTGPQNGIWALVNPAGPNSCEVETEDDIPEVEDRAIKIMKYNRIEKKMLI